MSVLEFEWNDQIEIISNCYTSPNVKSFSRFPKVRLLAFQWDGMFADWLDLSTGEHEGYSTPKHNGLLVELPITDEEFKHGYKFRFIVDQPKSWFSAKLTKCRTIQLQGNEYFIDEVYSHYDGKTTFYSEHGFTNLDILQCLATHELRYRPKTNFLDDGIDLTNVNLCGISRFGELQYQ